MCAVFARDVPSGEFWQHFETARRAWNANRSDPYEGCDSGTCSHDTIKGALVSDLLSGDGPHDTDHYMRATRRLLPDV